MPAHDRHRHTARLTSSAKSTSANRARTACAGVAQPFGIDANNPLFPCDPKSTQQGRTRIGAQFEYNRFTRAWREQHPDGSRDDLLAAWRTYRSQPIDERGTIGDDL